MNKETKSNLIKLLLVGIPLIGFLTFMFWGLNQRSNQLLSEPSFTYGIIVDTYVGTKGREFIKYKFISNGHIYIGHEQYFPNREPEAIRIGDTCEVVYARSNPENHQVLEKPDKTLKIRRIPRKWKFNDNLD